MGRTVRCRDEDNSTAVAFERRTLRAQPVDGADQFEVIGFA
jgi:hypothetical protein